MKFVTWWLLQVAATTTTASASSSTQQKAVFMVRNNCKNSTAAAVTVGLLNRNGPTADCDPRWPTHLGYKYWNVDEKELVKVGLAKKLYTGQVLYEANDHISENLALSVAAVHDLLPVSATDIGVLGLNLTSLPVKFTFTKNSTVSPTGGYFTTHEESISWIMQHVLPRSNKAKFVFRPQGSKLIPYIAMERMVAIYMGEMDQKCISYYFGGGEASAKKTGLDVFLNFTSSSHWDTRQFPLTMMGYNSGLSEATGWCTRNKTMGVVASDQADSISFLTADQERRKTEITPTNPLEQGKYNKITFDPSVVYVAHVVSDGDNLDMGTATYDYLQRRKEICTNLTKQNKPCSPRTYTVSGATGVVSSALRAYYEFSAYNNSFMLPPSGANYYYPGPALSQGNQAKALLQHQVRTLRVAKSMDMTSSVIWDFTMTVNDQYFSSYIGSQVDSIFYSNAPYTANSKTTEQVFRDSINQNEGVVVFNELTRWGGTAKSPSNAGDGYNYPIDAMAALVAQQQKGSLNFVYDISWMILPDTFQQYADYLEQNHAGKVQLVDHRTLVDLSRQKYKLWPYQ